MGTFGDTLQGAIGGGMGGASMGGWGALAGAGLGGLAGMFGSNPQEEHQARLQKMEQEYSRRDAPHVGAAQGDLSSFRGNQQGLVSRLEALSQGKGPSLAQQQLQAAQDRNMRQQQAMAASVRGPSQSAAQFQAMNNAGMMGAQSAQDAASARIAEQQMALQQLGGALQGARGMDEQMSQFNAQQQNQIAMANLDAKLRSMGLNDQMRLAILQQQGGMSQGPSTGEQFLAGGGSMFQMGANQGGLQNLMGVKGGQASGGGF